VITTVSVERIQLATPRRRSLLGEDDMKPCNDCPFKKSTPLRGSPDWAQDVFKIVRRVGLKGISHSCHKTDPEADGYVKGQRRECAGITLMMLNEFDNTPGKGGVWKSIPEMILAYLKHWQKAGLLNDSRFEKASIE
jgi:hypothetical protein